MPAPPTFARAPGTLERWVGPTARVLRAGTGAVVVLEGAGAMVWAALTRPGTAEEVADAMSSVAPPGGGPAEARDVVDEALGRLVAVGLVEATRGRDP